MIAKVDDQFPDLVSIGEYSFFVEDDPKEVANVINKACQAAIDEAHQDGYNQGRADAGDIVADKAESRPAQGWSTAPVLRSDGTKWDGILYIVDGSGRKLGSMNHLEAKSVVDAHNKAESRPAHVGSEDYKAGWNAAMRRQAQLKSYLTTMDKCGEILELELRKVEKEFALYHNVEVKDGLMQKKDVCREGHPILSNGYCSQGHIRPAP